MNMNNSAGGGYMDLMTAEQAGHFLQSQANHQSSSLANGDLPHAHHAQATHNGHQVAAGLAQVTTLSTGDFTNLGVCASLEILLFMLGQQQQLAMSRGGHSMDRQGPTQRCTVHHSIQHSA